VADQQSSVTAVKLALGENERGEPLSIGLPANAADVAERAADLDVPVEIATDERANA
jgi:urocanate hydratase